MHEEMLTYGLKEGTKDVLLHIDDERVLKGKQCGCVCPNCKSPLVARRGKINQHHFAHAPECVPCGKGKMTALHIMAQNILKERKKFLLPPYKNKYVNKEAQTKIFEDVKLEEFTKVEDIALRPDCNCISKVSDAHSLWVEIYCRHKVDYSKINEIIHRKQYCVEVDFRDLLNKEYTEEDVIRRLESDSSHKEWISCPCWDNENERIRQKTLAEKERIDQNIQEENQRLKDIVNNWKQKGDDITTNIIIEEIQKKPFANSNVDNICIYNILVPNDDWVYFAKHNPKTDVGRKVFYTLIYYYVRANIFLSPNHNWVDSKITELLSQSNTTKANRIQLEYLLVLWVLGKLELYRYDKDENSQYGKIFVQKDDVRRSVLLNICEGKQNWDHYLANKDAYNVLSENYRKIQNGNDVIEILKICFPIKEEIKYITEPYGFNKELAGKNVHDLWKKINQNYQ